MHSFIPTPANHPLCKRERAAGPWRWFTKPIIYWEMMENSLWFGSYILAFAKALENHSHLTITGSRMMLFLKSGGIAKSSVHLQMCLSHSRNTVYLNVWSPVKLHSEKLHWWNAGNVVPIDIHSYNFYFLPWSSFILIRSKIPFISLEDCFTSLSLKKKKSLFREPYFQSIDNVQEIMRPSTSVFHSGFISFIHSRTQVDLTLSYWDTVTLHRE